MALPIILGIESSCDETAAAVVRGGEELLSNVVFSQIAAHQRFGGVVPEIASREHLRGIVPVVRLALEQSKQSYASIDAIAVTQGPGLAGALLVGVTYAKALAFAEEKPVIAVNHLEGHIHAVLLEERQSQPESAAAQPDEPALALVVSGGHTHLYLCEQSGNGGASWAYKNVGKTRDDAAGEAYDKVAKLLGYGYPGGPVIDQLAPHGNERAVKFAASQIKHPNRGERAASAERVDFSFSGIKTAVLRHVETHDMKAAIEARRAKLATLLKPKLEDYLAASDTQSLDLVASFQRAVVEDLVGTTLAAAEAFTAATLFVTGGVAANSALRTRFQQEATLPVFFPSRALSTDNAAMIAAAAYPKFLMKDFAQAEFSAEASMPLG
jgi:N6-L-threonylcarbamoyladenine synthase